MNKNTFSILLMLLVWSLGYYFSFENVSQMEDMGSGFAAIVAIPIMGVIIGCAIFCWVILRKDLTSSKSINTGVYLIFLSLFSFLGGRTIKFFIGVIGHIN